MDGMMLKILLGAATIVLASDASATGQSFAPTRAVIPDQATATAVGAAILHAYFGKEQFRDFGKEQFRDGAGYEATLEDSVWTVWESLPKGTIGGGPVVELSKADGRVLRIFLTR
jgi:hypothetical protein